MKTSPFRIFLQNKEGSILDVTGHITSMIVHTDCEGALDIDITIQGFTTNEFKNKEPACLQNSKLMIE